MSWRLQALEYSTLAISSYHDSGNATQVHTGLAVTAVWIRELDTAIIHLRDVLGDQTHESLAREGETMKPPQPWLPTRTTKSTTSEQNSDMPPELPTSSSAPHPTCAIQRIHARRVSRWLHKCNVGAA